MTRPGSSARSNDQLLLGQSPRECFHKRIHNALATIDHRASTDFEDARLWKHADDGRLAFGRCNDILVNQTLSHEHGLYMMPKVFSRCSVIEAFWAFLVRVVVHRVFPILASLSVWLWTRINLP